MDHAGAAAGLAVLFLPLRVDLGVLYHRAGQHLARPPLVSRGHAHRRLAARDQLVDRRADHRLFLGDVEFLRLPEMDLPGARGGGAAPLRDARAGLRRLPALRTGTIRSVSSGDGVVGRETDMLCANLGIE